tara:strand:- start:374 stop:745 length:372 start_codon:yes stop_codon:yes gene_type:complete
MKTTDELKDPAVLKAIEQLGLEPHKKGMPAKPKGSGTKVVETNTIPVAPEKKKKVTLELTVQQEARAIREASVLNISMKDYLQNLLDEKLQTDVGRALIGGSSFMNKGGAKVLAPSNTFGREI